MRLEQITAKALEKTGNDRYLLSIAVSKRVNQLLNGATPKIDKDLSNTKPADIALEEIAQGLVEVIAKN
jgi:DNA-directed RNA polymerase subunit omega